MKKYKCCECGKITTKRVGTGLLSWCTEKCETTAKERMRAAFDPRKDEFDGSALQAAARLPTRPREALGALARMVAPPSLASSVERFLGRVKAEAESLDDE